MSQLFADASFSAPATDDSSNLASGGSTPPTTVADSASLHSDASRHDAVAPVAPPAAVDIPSPRRARRARAASPVYNLSRLSGTSAHGKRRSRGDIVSDRRRRRRRTVSGDDALVGSIEAGRLDALHLDVCPARLHARPRRSSSRLSGAGSAPVPALTTKLSRELRRLQDTKEFSHIDDKPVIHTVWANGKYVDPDRPAQPPARRKAKVETPEVVPKLEEPEPITHTRKWRPKKFLVKGLYAGQETPPDVARGLTTAEKKELARFPELLPGARENKVLPLPLFAGFRVLLNGRDFKLPYHVCNPLPPGQPKPDEWKKMTKNRFIGGSREYWKKMPHMHDYQSKCVCLPDDGCGETCQNRIMLYECDATNCNIGAAHCTNRAFAHLTARRAKGGKYRVGVEVIKTSDRGYGVRSNRCFQPNQIIMEYAGEIITEGECERRMKEIYRNNHCYYLMSFDQNMIIDATAGSIARFVNHSCRPNCRMIKWIVSGQPRMALFAGDQPISTGEELTYDYNFDPFSAKNVQKCLCGQPNCRGVLGPKPREVKAPKPADLKTAAKATTVKARKRKLKELAGDEENGAAAGGGKAKKRKAQPAKGGAAKALSTARAAATAARNKASPSSAAMAVKPKKTAAGSRKTPATPRVAKKPAATRTTRTTATTIITTKRVFQTYGQKAALTKQASARLDTTTIVALGLTEAKAPKKPSPETETTAAKPSPEKGKTVVCKAALGKSTPAKRAAARRKSLASTAPGEA